MKAHFTSLLQQALEITDLEWSDEVIAIELDRHKMPFPRARVGCTSGSSSFYFHTAGEQARLDRVMDDIQEEIQDQLDRFSARIEKMPHAHRIAISHEFVYIYMNGPPPMRALSAVWLAYRWFGLLREAGYVVRKRVHGESKTVINSQRCFSAGWR